MIILGITGGVGSGKSRVLYDLENRHGALVIEADKLAHELMEPGKTIYNRIVQAFGVEILGNDKDRHIDRQKLGSIVFNNSEKLKLLDSISHPLVKKEIKRIIDIEEKHGKTKLLVIEAALLIQDGYREICDEIWYVYVGREERVKRLMKQRGYTEDKCYSIFDSQASEYYYKMNSDFTINNEGDYETTCEQINARLKKIL